MELSKITSEYQYELYIDRMWELSEAHPGTDEYYEYIEISRFVEIYEDENLELFK